MWCLAQNQNLQQRVDKQVLVIMSPKFSTQKIVSKISKNLDDFRIPALLPPPQRLLIHYSSEKHKNYLKLSSIFNSLWKKMLTIHSEYDLEMMVSLLETLQLRSKEMISSGRRESLQGTPGL